jgi:hypothetical protein
VRGIVQSWHQCSSAAAAVAAAAAVVQQFSSTFVHIIAVRLFHQPGYTAVVVDTPITQAHKASNHILRKPSYGMLPSPHTSTYLSVQGRVLPQTAVKVSRHCHGISRAGHPNYQGTAVRVTKLSCCTAVCGFLTGPATLDTVPTRPKKSHHSSQASLRVIFSVPERPV